MEYLEKTTNIYRFDEIESEVYRATSREQLFSEESFSRKIYDRLDKMLPENGILSLDVFDTVILRDSSSELTRFYEIGRLMSDFVNNAYKDGDKDLVKLSFPVRGVDAFLARHMGTKATYRASRPVHGCREGSLREIHLTASRLLSGNESLADAFIDIEIDYEATRLVKNSLLLDYIKKHKARGGCVILVSDMYMHADQINSLLCRLDVDVNLFDYIFSSADTKISKASGKIFRTLKPY